MSEAKINYRIRKWYRVVSFRFVLTEGLSKSEFEWLLQMHNLISSPSYEILREALVKCHFGIVYSPTLFILSVDWSYLVYIYSHGLKLPCIYCISTLDIEYFATLYTLRGLMVLRRNSERFYPKSFYSEICRTPNGGSRGLCLLVGGPRGMPLVRV